MSRDHLLPALLRKRARSTSPSFVQRVFLFGVLLFLLLSQLLGNGVFASSPVFAASKPQAIPAHMTFQQFLNEMKQDQQKRPAFAGPRTPANPYTKYEHFADYSKLPPGAEPPSMQPIRATLTSAFLAGGAGTQPLDLMGSDHRLEVQVAPGSFDLSHASVSTSGGNTSRTKPSATPTPAATSTVTPTPSTTPTTSPTPTSTPRKGRATATPQTTPAPTVIPTATTTPTPSSSTLSEPLTLVLTQRHGHFAGEMNQLGSYQIQILDANGQQVTGIVFRQPLTFVYHYQNWEMTALDLDPGKLFFTWYDPTESGPHPKLPLSDFILPMHNDPKAHTLTVQSAIMGTGIFTSGIGDPQNQSPSTPQVASVQGNSGQLSYALPIQVAPGVDGFDPQLQLAYSSEATNEQHSYTSPAGAVGEGWSLSLGSISAVPYPSSSAAGANTWYFLSGVDGISDRLVQDTTITSGTFYDTEHISHFRIQQIQKNSEPCFAVWDTSGTYYEFGCTPDSLQYRRDSNGLHLYEFDLNEIIAPNDGNSSNLKIILVHYFQDCGSSTGSCPSAANSSGSMTIRDAGIEQIQYGTGSPGTINQIDGTVDFHYLAQYVGSTPAQWAATYASQNYQCNGTPPITVSPLMRCDDPQNYSGGANAPSVMSTLTLDKVTSYVGPDGTGGYPAYEYDFSYTDTPFTSYNPTNGNTCADPTTNPPVDEYCAGEHLLNQVTPKVYKDGTANALKPVLFHYYSFINTYSDRSDPLPGGLPYIVTIQRSFLDYYFDTERGTGAHIYYNRAYNNTHGTPYDKSTGDNRYDPFYCPDHAGNSDPSLDCNTQNSVFNYPDDHAWTVQAVTQITSLNADSSGLNAATTTYSYLLATTGVKTGSTCPADSQQDTNCVGDNWLPIDTGNGNKDADWQDFYHGEFRGFNYVSIISPSNDLTVDQYYSTEGWHTPEGDAANYNSGAMYQEDVYQGPSATSSALLEETKTVYPGFTDNNSCYGKLDLTYVPCQASPESITTTIYDNTGSGNGNAPWVKTAYTYDDYAPTPVGNGIGAGYGNILTETISSANASTVTKQYTYAITDSGYNATGWIFYDVNKIAHSEIDDSSGHKWKCESITYDEGAPTGTPTPAAGWPTTVNTYTSASCTPNSFGTPLTTSYTGYDAYGNTIATVDPVAVANSAFYGSTGISGKNGCTLSSAPAIMSSNWGKTSYTTCTAYDSTYNALPISFTNAFGQKSTVQYDPQQGNLPTASTDVNGQTTTTTYSYDGSGNSTAQISEPGEVNPPNGPGYTTQSSTKSTCQSTIPSGTITPCYEVDTSSSLYPNAVTETFYDGDGRKVETRTPGPDSGYDTIQFTSYDDQNNSTFESVPFEVTSGSGWVDPNGAKDKNGNTPAGTVTFSDAMGRTIATQDPIFGSPGINGISCPSLQQDDPSLSSYNSTDCIVYQLDGVSGFGGDNNTYTTTKSIDPNNHVTEMFIDALGNTRYVRYDSGVNSGTLTPNELKSVSYNVLNEPISITVTDQSPQSGPSLTSVTTTMQYDDLGRLTQLSDPDRGSHTYSYDADGHVLTDTSGTRTIGYNYDLLERVGCVQIGSVTSDADGSCSTSKPLVQNTYDTTLLGTQGSTDFPVGRLTKSVATTYYPEGGSLNTTEKTQYDQRGRVVTAQEKFSLPNAWNVTTALPTYQASFSYNDANQLTATATSTIVGTQSTPGYTFTEVYDSTLGILTGLSNNGTGVANLATLNYNVNDLLGKIYYQTSTGSNLAYEQFHYDGDLRPTEETATWQGGSGQSGQVFDESRSYDPASNITAETTTIEKTGGQTGSNTETQNFCYDEQDRLTWASNTATPPAPGNGTCGSLTPANGFSGASYTDSFTYTHLGQLWSGPVNGTGSSLQYLYCNSNAPHQLQGIYPTTATCSNPGTASYAVQYDSWGNVTQRTYNGQTATLSYDKLDQMVEWQVPNTNQAWYAYDANGDRSIQRSTVGSTTSMTVYAFGLEEYSYDGSGNLQSSTHYYSLAGHLIGELTGSGTPTTSFFMTDALGSILATFSNTASSAAMLGNQLYGPYGNQLYQSGSMNTNKGYTGQYNDPVSGLDYYVSRYYDPVAGIFLSTDLTQNNEEGMDPYSYVGGNPETDNDPTGQAFVPPGGGGVGGDGGSSSNNTPPGGATPSNSPSCAWYDLGCNAQNAWDRITQFAQHVTQVVRQDITHPTQMQIPQEVEKVVVRAIIGLVAKVIAIVVAAAAFALLIYAAVTHFFGGSKSGGWNDSQQRQIAYRLAQQVQQKRESDTRRAPYAQGCIGIGSNPCTEDSQIVPGFGRNNNLFHAERQIYSWAMNLIKTKYQNVAPGTTINIMIYVQEIPCTKFCQKDIPIWARELQAAAPPGVKVNLYVWYQPSFDVDNPLANPITSPRDIARYYP